MYTTVPMPRASVWTEPVTEPPPPCTLQLIATSATGLPNWSRDRTVIGTFWPVITQSLSGSAMI